MPGLVFGWGANINGHGSLPDFLFYVGTGCPWHPGKELHQQRAGDESANDYANPE
jgi:hypothetical protein